MSLYLVAPKALTYNSGNQNSTFPASNLNLDYPSMVWRSSNLTTVYVTMQLDGSAWDTISLYGTNLRATDTIRIRAASSAANTTASPTYDSGTVPAFSGTANSLQNMTLLGLGTARTEAFVRIDITATSHPAGYVSAQRLIIGKRVEDVGMDHGAEQSYEDPSELTDYRGFTSVDALPSKMMWKFTVSGVNDAKWLTEWMPFVRDMGSKKGFLLVPDHASTYVQNEATFGRLLSSAKGMGISSNEWKLDLTVKEI